MHKTQKGACAICSLVPDEGLVVDHNHTTGVVRGLLCRKCNLGIGYFQDNILTIAAAGRYLGSKAQEQVNG